jgi:hypothetical protein
MGNSNAGRRSGGHKTRQQHKRVLYQGYDNRKKIKAGREIVPKPKQEDGTFEIVSRFNQSGKEMLQVILLCNGKSDTQCILNNPRSFQKTCQFKQGKIKIIVRVPLAELRDRVKYSCTIERKP